MLLQIKRLVFYMEHAEIVLLALIIKGCFKGYNFCVGCWVEQNGYFEFIFQCKVTILKDSLLLHAEHM